MSLTLPELITRLADKYDPDVLLEMLNITSQELVSAFEDRVLEKQEELLELLAEDDEFQPEEYQEDDNDSR